MIGMKENQPSMGRLFIFDFDDTLVKTGAKILVHHAAGHKSAMSSHQYATYNKHPDDRFNFEQFESLTEPVTPLPFVKKLQNTYDSFGPDHIVILTARSNPAPVITFLDRIGLDDIEDIIALNSINPRDKADWIEQQMITRNPTKVDFWDDSEKNIKAVDRLKKQFGSNRIITHLVR